MVTGNKKICVLPKSQIVTRSIAGFPLQTVNSFALNYETFRPVLGGVICECVQNPRRPVSNPDFDLDLIGVLHIK